MNAEELAKEATLADRVNRLSIAVVWMLPAAVVPCCALLWAADSEHEGLSLAVAPFGWWPLVVSHVLLTLPLAWVIANLVQTAAPVAVSRGAAWLWSLSGLLVAWATVIAGPLAGRTLDALSADFSARAAVRSVWCLALALPWTLAVIGRVEGNATRSRRIVAWRTVSGLIAVVAATVLPGVYTRSWIESQSAAAETAIVRGQVQQARCLVQGLCDLGGDLPLAGLAPRERLREAILLMAAMLAEAEQPLQADATDAARIERGRLLAALERRQEARQVLAGLADQNAQAALLTAAMWQEDQRWTESDRAYRIALNLLPTEYEATSASDSNRLRAFLGLAHNARADGRYEAAEEIYLAALQALPHHAAEIHLQLGLHHQLGGRPAEARRHLATAADQGDAETRRRAVAELRGLGGTLPGCWLGPTEALFNLR